MVNQREDAVTEKKQVSLSAVMTELGDVSFMLIKRREETVPSLVSALFHP